MTKRSVRSQPKKKMPALHITRTQACWAIGLLLIALALLTVLSLLASNSGVLTTAWRNMLRQAVGLGVFLMPPLLTLLGLWTITQTSAKRWPWPVLRSIGALFVLVAALSLTHHLADPARSPDIAKLGGGLGRDLSQGLTVALGWAGALVVLLLFVGIGILLLFDVAFDELTASTMALLRRLGDWLRQQRQQWLEQRARRRAARRAEGKSTPPVAAPPPPPPALGRPAGSAALRSAGFKSAQQSPKATSEDDATEIIASANVSEEHAWTLPSLFDTLIESEEGQMSVGDIRENTRIIEETLKSLGVPVTVVEVNPGPVVTQFGIEPGYIERRDRTGKTKRVKIKVSKISSLSNDLALALAASPIRIEAPVPGKGIVGLEVPNAEIATVRLRGVMESPQYAEMSSSHLAVALGRDVSGAPMVADLARLPHLLIAGATGSGKSVCINALIACLLLRNTPDQLKMLMIDPKRVELSVYNGIPHLLAPVVVEAERVVGVLNWVAHEMDRRYREFAKVGARNIVAYNGMAIDRGERALPYIAVFIDELADLMMVAPDDVERSICRIAQMARATGIHLIIATQRPSVDVVTGLIKANFPARIAFAVSSSVDSRVIIDTPGADKLLGRGDSLYMAPDSSKLQRMQGCYLTDEEIQRLVSHWRAQVVKQQNDHVLADVRPGKPFVQKPLWPDQVEDDETTVDGQDPLLNEAIALVTKQQRASVSLLQRHLHIGYSRAGRLIDTLQERGVIGPATGSSRAREVLAPAHTPKPDSVATDPFDDDDTDGEIAP